ncbi:MAG: glycosyltransferase family 4 protein [Acidimicrobiaceae bacterium]|nr:glycosyltransferase family 4 protein [Acidimicrobiaceae bacterium]
MTRLMYLTADRGVPVLGHKGASVHVRELCTAFAEAGVEVHIASPRIDAEGDQLSAPAKLHHVAPVVVEDHIARTLPGAVQDQARSVAALCTRLGVDAIYERFSLFTAAGVRTAAQLGLRHVLEVNAPLRQEAARYRTLPYPELAASLEAEVMAETDRVLAVSKALARVLGADGVDASRIEVVPNGVASERFAPARRDPERFVVGFAGSMKPWHGIETLVDAVLAVPNVHLEVVGHGPQEALLDRLPAKQVTRFGTLPHARVMELMASWDVGLAPYAPVEGFWFSPMKVLEYMAAGACPVASDLGDAAELLGQGRRGVLIPPADAEALAAALARLAADRERAWVLGADARAWVAAHRPWSANASRALALLRRQEIPQRA